VNDLVCIVCRHLLSPCRLPLGRSGGIVVLGLRIQDNDFGSTTVLRGGSGSGDVLVEGTNTGTTPLKLGLDSISDGVANGLAPKTFDELFGEIFGPCPSGTTGGG
jgi:hypothetical protein